MPCTISPSEDGHYIVLTVRGDLTADSAMRQNLEAHALGEKLGIARFLVDATESRNVESVTRNYRFAYEDMKLPPGINRNARVAMVVSPEDHSHDFIETVSRNAGFDVTLFRDREQAIRHLLQGIEDPQQESVRQ